MPFERWISALMKDGNQKRGDSVVIEDKVTKNAASSVTESDSTSLDQQSANEQDSLQPNAQSCSIDSVAQTLSDNPSQKIPKNSENTQSSGSERKLGDTSRSNKVLAEVLRIFDEILEECKG